MECHTIHTAHSPSKLNWITAEKSSLYEEYNTHSFLFGFWFRFRFAPIMLRLLLYFLKSLPRLLHISCIFHNPFVLWKYNEFYSLFGAVVADVLVHFRYVLLLLFAIFQRWALGPQRLSLNFPCSIPAHHHFPLSVCSFLLTLPLTLVVPSCQRENCNLIKLLDSAQFTIHAPANSPLYHAIFRVAVQIISIVECAAFEVHN